MNSPASSNILSLAQLLVGNPTPEPCLIEPGVLPHQGILFVGGEPKVGKSLLVCNLALALAAGRSRSGFDIPVARRVLICQFELPTQQLALRLSQMRRPLGSAADDRLFIDTRSTGHLLSTPVGINHFLVAARAAQAEVIVLDPLYSAHDQDENDTRAMAALCQSLLRLREAARAAIIVVHHVRKSVARHEIGSAFRGSSALHAVGDSYLLLTRPACQNSTVELRFQFRYTPPLEPRLLTLDPRSLWFASTGSVAASPVTRRKVDTDDVRQAVAAIGNSAGFNALRDHLMQRSSCSKRTAQLAIAHACRQGSIERHNGQYRLSQIPSSYAVAFSHLDIAVGVAPAAINVPLAAGPEDSGDGAGYSG